ncbi:hypothetical protein [Flavobacterium sp. GT3R68]|uniref:hypothetical protein n=1 Tax=Flavobacterium sp. GT3R68 TaxID=2594437 RepID=UPI000F85CF64|nr:hypothetical protein [Flavobacterium sp. GT3R68]RTY85907.1 hypothetical protein EKL32_28220 [Flavobacterium sp. GSN2]TRW89341.1 hypothetical protein FNW07_13500 [Flavobacterium sp. GT3R68]
MRKHISIVILISIITLSCNKSQQIANDFELNQIVTKSNKIIIKTKKSNETEGTRNDSSFESYNTLETKSDQQIKSLGGTLRQPTKTDYCCCPQTNYSISFYKDDKRIGIYFVDTIEFKNKVRVFEGSYQYSMIIEKEFWKNYLKELKPEN